MLSEEQIASTECAYLSAHAQFIGAGEVWIEGVSDFARAIESAACAEREELLKQQQARIAELEQQLAEAMKDAERYRNIRDNEDARAALAGPCDPDHLDRVVDATISAIRAAIKEQT